MTQYIKYPRTPHLPWSRGASDDDIFATQKLIAHFAQMREVVVTEKMDGENTSLYPDHMHARAIIGIDHPSRSWVKSLHAKIKHEIPHGWRICGENLYAKHSIEYHNLDSYFMVFAIFDDQNQCLSWDDTVSYCSILGLITVPVLYKGTWNTRNMMEFDKKFDKDTFEGYVVRNSGSFCYDDYGDNIAKYVRPNHVKTSDHWRNQVLTINSLKE